MCCSGSEYDVMLLTVVCCNCGYQAAHSSGCMTFSFLKWILLTSCSSLDHLFSWLYFFLWSLILLCHLFSCVHAFAISRALCFRLLFFCSEWFQQLSRLGLPFYLTPGLQAFSFLSNRVTTVITSLLHSWINDQGRNGSSRRLKTIIRAFKYLEFCIIF